MKYLRLFIVLLFLAMFPLVAQATTYNFTPYDNNENKADIFDLDHNYLYLWGINYSLSATEVITGATISIANINDWQLEANDILKFYLLDNARINDQTAQVDVLSIYDGEGRTTNNEVPKYKTNPLYDPNASQNSGKKFTDYLTLGTTYTDNNGWTVEQFSYAFSNSELAWLSEALATANPFIDKNANFGMAFDPDCHYYNDGITLTITTTTRQVPEPGAILLLGLSLLGFFWARKLVRD
ncbi:MAG TPA: PEP-CTERM sorting domain-containing protein [Syntrophorhabdaceae bacterium]|nr:PEP-CTERM sorting domain-containing protein [Syntrophorhabdaceae bacterium]